MYRMPIQDPRYRHGPNDRETKRRRRRHREPRDSSDGSSSEEDEESTDRYTEESEDTAESHAGGRRERHDWSPESSKDDRTNCFSKLTRPEKLLMRAYLATEGVPKEDKITQKNFLSPFPSFLIPPIYREVAGPPNYRFVSSAVREDMNDRMNFEKAYKSTTKKSEKYEDENMCMHCPARRVPKLCDKHKSKKDQKSSSKGRYERIMTCLQGESSMEPSAIFVKDEISEEGFSKSPTRAGEKRPKSHSRDEKSGQAIRSCKGCLPVGRKGRRIVAERCHHSEESGVEEGFPVQKGEEEKLERGVAGKLREKLVYVVEEEGKDVTKVETDLFTVNEILTIKKDLLELSEFAKKLKKLKEMKRDAEKGNVNKSGCQCKPVAELLRNVNQRIEALEARQEELERGSGKSTQKEYTETESKKTTEPKTLSDSPPKASVVRNESAMTTDLSVPKTDVIISRADCSNNSEIVNELMDIKTQLQKLEKRRMSKEMTAENAPVGEPKGNKKKDHAIAVFSSRTYILTAEHYEKKKQTMTKEVKSKGLVPALEESKSKTEQTKDNVVNWLKQVSPMEERSDNDIALFLEADNLEGNPGQSDYNCAQFFNDNIQNQEPQKNRASADSTNRLNFELLTNDRMKEFAGGQPGHHLTCKECVVTPAGKVYLREDLSLAWNAHPERKKMPKLLPPPHPKRLPKVVRRSASSCSVTSAKLIQQNIRRQRTRTLKQIIRDSSRLLASQSQSTQELSLNSSGCKDEKTKRNLSMKNLTSPMTKDKIHKESKNEFVKRLENNLMALRKNFGRGDSSFSTSSCSEFIRTVNLEKESDSIGEREKHYGKNTPVYSYGTMMKLHFKGLEPTDELRHCRNAAKEKQKKEIEEAAREAARTAARAAARAAEQAAVREAAREAARTAALKEELEKAGTRRKSSVCSLDICQKIEEEIKRDKNMACKCSCCCKKKTTPRSSECESKSETQSKEDCACKKETRSRRKSCKPERKGSSEWRRRCSRDCRRELKKEKERIKKEMKAKSKECRKERKKEQIKRRCEERLARKRMKELCKEKKKISKCRVHVSDISCKCEGPVCKCKVKEMFESSQTIITGHSRPGDQRYNDEKPTDSMCFRTQSVDSLDMYLKRRKLKSVLEKEKLADESCTFKNIFKKLKLYPNFSSQGAGNLPGDAFTKKSLQQQAKGMGNEEESDNLDFYESPRHRRHHHHHQDRYQGVHSSNQPCENTYHNREGKLEHMKNCKCVRVYLQTHEGQKWPGVAPVQSAPSESQESLSSKKSVETVESLKSDFIFPGKPPESQCIAYSSQKKCCKKKKRARRRKSKRCKCPKISEENVCTCAKCGNRHEKCEKQENVRYDSPAKDAAAQNATTKCNCNCPTGAQAAHVNIPMFSFLRYFCKSKPRSTSVSKQILRKMSELRRLKVCAQVRPRKQRSKSKCFCETRINEFEERLTQLEQSERSGPSECSSTCRTRRRKRKKVKKSRKKKSRKKRNKCTCSEESSKAASQESEDCGCKKGKKKSKKKESEKKKKCSEDSREDIQTYYCSCPALEKFFGTTETNETSQTGTPETVMTATATPVPTDVMTAVTERKPSTTLKSKVEPPPKKDWGIMEKLSSFQCFLRNFYRRSKPEENPKNEIIIVRESDLIKNLKEGSPKMRERIIHQLKSEPSNLMKKIKKLKPEKTTKNKEGSRKETERGREKAHEKRSPKLPHERRHRE